MYPGRTSWSGQIEDPAETLGRHGRAVPERVPRQAAPPRPTALPRAVSSDLPREAPSHAPSHQVPCGPAADVPRTVGPVVLGSRQQDRASDPLADTDAYGGLHKFDLGMVPASVTPPPTWRRAAWFSIGSAAAAFSGLVLATFALVDTTHVQSLDFPSLPRGGEFPPLPGHGYTTEEQQQALPWAPSSTTSPSQPWRLSPSAGPTPAPGVPGQPGVPGGPPGEGTTERPSAPGQPGDPEPTGPGNGGPTTGPTEPGESTETTAPPSSTTPTTESSLVLFSNRAMHEASAEYFSAVSDLDLSRAYSMTAGDLRSEGYESFAARYADAQAIEVRSVEHRSASTVTTLRITREDGSVLTQRRELRFTVEREPKIRSDEKA